MRKRFITIAAIYPKVAAFMEKQDFVYYPNKIAKDIGFEPEITTIQHKGQKKEEVVNGVKVKRFRCNIALLFYLYKNRKNIALIHAELRPFPSSLLAGLLPNKKVMTPITYSLGSNKLVILLSKILMKHFNKIIAITPYEYGIYLKNSFKKRNITLIPLALDCKFFSKKIKNKDKIRKKYNINQNEFIITTITNFRKFKNIDTILKAFKGFNDKHNNSKLILVGKNLLKDNRFKEQKRVIGEIDIERLIEKLNLKKNVILTGFLDQEGVREILNISNIFVNISDPEAQGLAVYEAAAVGIPLCLSNIGSFKTVFKSWALYSPPREYKKLAENLIDYYKNKKIIAKNTAYLKKLMKKWDYSIIEKKLSDLYKEVMK